jgi:hypothetical protein
MESRFATTERDNNCATCSHIRSHCGEKRTVLAFIADRVPRYQEIRPPGAARRLERQEPATFDVE